MIDAASTAVHESSHAVAAKILGVRVHGLRLLPEGGGICELAPLAAADPMVVRAALVILAAGAAAEAVVRLPEASAWKH